MIIRLVSFVLKDGANQRHNRQSQQRTPGCFHRVY